MLLAWQAWPMTMTCKKRSSRQCALYLSQAIHEATSNGHGRVAIRDTVQREPACLVEHGFCAVQVSCATPK